MQKRQHITDKEIKILEYFYKNKRGHVRKIKRFVNLSEHTLLKYLSLLEKNNMLKCSKSGNLKIFEANINSQLIKLFFSYFSILRLERLEYTRKKAINEFLSKIMEIKLPYFVLLFGSTAKESYTKESDIDMLLVYDTANKIKEKIDKLVTNIYAETGLKIRFLIMQLEDFIKENENKENYALRDAINTGYPIFGGELFYEVILK